MTDLHETFSPGDFRRATALLIHAAVLDYEGMAEVWAEAADDADSWPGLATGLCAAIFEIVPGLRTERGVAAHPPDYVGPGVRGAGVRGADTGSGAQDHRFGGCVMTREELAAWAARHGLTVIPTVHYTQLCAEAAAGIAASDLDRDLADLIGR